MAPWTPAPKYPPICHNCWKKIRITEAFRPKIPVPIYFLQQIGVRLSSSSGKACFMARITLAWSVVALVALTAGCTMCASPHDDCGPTYTGECGAQCAPNARGGSILSEPLETFSTHDMVPVPDNFVGSVSHRH